MNLSRFIFLLLLLLATSAARLSAQEEPELNLDSIRQDILVERGDFEKMRLYYNMSYKLLDYDLDFARECCEKTIALASKLQMPYYEADGYRYLSKYYEYTDNLDSALECCFHSLKIIDGVLKKSSTDSVKSLQSQCFNFIGSYFSNRGQFSEAVDYYHKALVNSEPAFLPYIYMNLGLISGNSKVYDVAIEHMKKSREIAASLSDSSAILNADLMLSTVYIDMFETQRDINALTHAVYLADKLASMVESPQIDLYNLLNISIVLPQIYIDAYNYYLETEDESIDEYLEKAESLNDIGVGTEIDFYMPDLLATKVKILIAKNELFDAGRILCEITGTPAYIEVAPKYFLAIGDYKSALEALEAASTKDNQDFSLEYTVKSEKLFAQTQYEDEMKQMDLEEKDRSMRFEQEMSRNKIRNIFLSVIVAISLAIVIYIIRLFMKISKDNKLLEAQNKTIAERNAELISMGEEVLAQTEEIKSQSNIIQSQRDDLDEINQRLLASITYASRIQKAAVPQDSSMSSIFGDIFIYWRPLEIVSGDYYWAMESNGLKYLIVADSTGHGVPGALVSILGISLLNDLSAHIHSIADSGDFLDKFKAKFLDCIKNIDDGMDLALMIIDDASHKIQFTGAKRPLIRVRDGEVTEFKPDKICIGHNYLREHVKFTTTEIDTKPGDMYYAFSDGLSDQFGGPHSTKYTLSRLKQLLAGIASEPADKQSCAISDSIGSWMKSDNPFPQIDDQLIIGFRVA